MIKDIVVNLGVGERGSPAGDYAVSIAATFDAHVAAIAFIYDSILPGSGAGYIPAAMFETQQRDASARAGSRPSRSVGFAGSDAQFGRIARHFDLSIVGQAEHETGGVEGMVIEAALFESGRPVIVVPYIQKAPLKLERVMLCWTVAGRRRARLPMPCRSLSGRGASRWSSLPTNAVLMRRMRDFWKIPS